MQTWCKKNLSGVKSNYFFVQVNTSVWDKNKLVHNTQNVRVSKFLLVWVCRDMHYQNNYQLRHVYAKCL